MHFYVGLHQPSDAPHFNSCFVSVNRLRSRKSPFYPMRYWIMDSGAFTEISQHGDFRFDTDEYAGQIERWKSCGTLQAAVSQDYMCEPFILNKVNRSVKEHQDMTIARYYSLKQRVTSVYLLPVLQGFYPTEYVEHIRSYSSLLPHLAWVGVGSVCKRNSTPGAVHEVLLAIKQERPDLRLHGFGLKLSTLVHPMIRSLLWSADSMAWSFRARKAGRNANDWREAETFRNMIERPSHIYQQGLPF